MAQPHPVLVTGGAGFIGSNFVREWLSSCEIPLVNLDALTYAGSLHNLADLSAPARHRFVEGNIGDAERIGALLRECRPTAIVNLAAETHVDRSIAGPTAFIDTNLVGTFSLLETTLDYWRTLSDAARAAFRFLHVSTDEVFGSLAPDAPGFTERHAYAPRSPYSASKAGADHLVMAFHHTYGLPVLITNCSNNYGPYQHPEKLIPLAISRALSGETIPVYGDGQQRRDWLFVTDHCRALRRVLDSGTPGSSYNVGGNAEVTNIELVRTLCDLLDALQPAPNGRPYRELIRFVTDRPGHDRRYAIDSARIAAELGWRPQVGLMDGLAQTARWYLDHPDWVQTVGGTAHAAWLEQQYVGR